jgi:TonB family protein
VALIFLFGTKKQIVPRTVSNVPQVQLADNADEFIALGDPTLFARPTTHDVVAAFWRHMPAVTQPDFTWTEPPRYLPPAPEDFGAAFRGYLRNHETTGFALDFKPEPRLIPPAMAFESALPPATTSQISGDLRQRRLLSGKELQSLPSLPLNDVIAPSKVQALVDTAGNVLSAVVLESSGDNNADQLALQRVRNLRFAPAPGLTLGEITIHWRTVPTHAPPSATP